METKNPVNHRDSVVKETVLVIIRDFDASPELVWKAWTDPEHIKLWWGPKNFTAPFSRIDLSVGGTYLLCMRSPEGQEYWTTGVYREIIPLKRIVYTDSFSDENGNVVSSSYYGLGEDFPLELLVTVSFEDTGGKTRMTLRHEGLPAGEIKDMTGTSWNESFDKLEESL